MAEEINPNPKTEWYRQLTNQGTRLEVRDLQKRISRAVYFCRTKFDLCELHSCIEWTTAPASIDKYKQALQKFHCVALTDEERINIIKGIYYIFQKYEYIEQDPTYIKLTTPTLFERIKKCLTRKS